MSRVPFGCPRETKEDKRRRRNKEGAGEIKEKELDMTVRRLLAKMCG